MRAALAVFAIVALLGCESTPSPRGEPMATFITEGGEITVAVEIAKDPATRTRGLMHRAELGAFAGMVFVFPAQSEQQFWMKNTLIPLDMIFIDEDLEVVGIIHKAEPLTETMRSVPSPCRFVVEVNGGFAAKHGIDVGTRVVFEHVQ